MTRKNCVLLNLVQKFIEIEAWLLLAWLLCLQNQLCSIHSIATYQRISLFEKGDSSNRQKMNEQLLRQNLSWFLSQHMKTLIFRGFILKPTKTASVLPKNGTTDSQNSPPFDRSACFYVTITGNFERFQYSNFQTNYLKNENLFQKTGVPFFS